MAAPSSPLVVLPPTTAASDIIADAAALLASKAGSAEAAGAVSAAAADPLAAGCSVAAGVLEDEASPAAAGEASLDWRADFLEERGLLFGVPLGVPLPPLGVPLPPLGVPLPPLPLPGEMGARLPERDEPAMTCRVPNAAGLSTACRTPGAVARLTFFLCQEKFRISFSKASRNVGAERL